MSQFPSRGPRSASRWRCHLLAVVFLATAAIAAGVNAEAGNDSKRVMTLTGFGEVRAAPDLGHITIGVTSEAAGARAALARNTAAMTAVINALRGHGITARDLQTSNFSLTPRYARDNRNQDTRTRITGYRAVNQVTVIVRRLERMGELMDLAVTLGSNQIQQIRFSLSKPQRHMDEARRLATRDALRKAKLFAEAAGVTLGPVTNFTEVIRHQPQPRFARAMAMEAKGGPAPVSPGEQTLRAQVNITWQLQ